MQKKYVKITCKLKFQKGDFYNLKIAFLFIQSEFSNDIVKYFVAQYTS